MYWQTTAAEQHALNDYIDGLTVRAGNGMIRYYLKQDPEHLHEYDWCNCLLDIFFFRYHENNPKK